MSFAGFSFCFWRILQILTLIPILGMLAWFVDIYTEANSLTPRPLLILFIVATLGAAWTIGTLFLYARAKHSAGFVALTDLLFFGALIGAVYEMRHVKDESCSGGRTGPFTSEGINQVYTNKACKMRKAAWALAIL